MDFVDPEKHGKELKHPRRMGAGAFRMVLGERDLGASQAWDSLRSSSPSVN